MLADALQHVDEIGVRIDVMQSAGHQQTLHDANMSGAEFGPGEQPIAASHGDDPQGTLQMIRIDRHIRIVKVDFQPGSPFPDVGQRRQEGAARQEAIRLELFVDPFWTEPRSMKGDGADTGCRVMAGSLLRERRRVRQW
jgi:hypothetical protein